MWLVAVIFLVAAGAVAFTRLWELMRVEEIFGWLKTGCNSAGATIRFF